jgi:hypothetical protein
MENQISTGVCIYKDHEYPLTSHIFNNGEKSSRIAFPHLPDDYVSEMTLVHGEQLTMEFMVLSNLLKYKFF